MISARFLLLAGLVPCALAVPAAAQNSIATTNQTAPRTAKAKSAKATPASASDRERRPGELEGFDSGIKGSAKPRAKPPADVIGERRLPDGGLPLPEQRGGGIGQAPVGFDKNGNMGGMFKF